MPEYFSENVLTVSELNGLVKELFDNVPVFSYIKLRGEISNFTNHRSGHFYFTLKDDNAALKAVMFKGSNAKLKFLPENGMRVVATGRLGVFERDGVYQLYVSDLAPDGVDYAFLPINGRGNNMNARDAADFAYEIGAKCAIPTHYGLVDDITPEEFDFDDRLILEPFKEVKI